MQQQNETSYGAGPAGKEALFMTCGYASPCGRGSWCAGMRLDSTHRNQSLISNTEFVFPGLLL
jgi:hypothetical protein